jgi:hypothetical protein
MTTNRPGLCRDVDRDEDGVLAVWLIQPCKPGLFLIGSMPSASQPSSRSLRVLTARRSTAFFPAAAIWLFFWGISLCR